MFSNFDHYVFDVDSTLVSIEGIDELARRAGVYSQVEPFTRLAMQGNLSFEEVFEKRLQLIKPTKSDLEWLGNQYLNHITPGAKEVIDQLHASYKKIWILSGGYDLAIYPLTDFFKIPYSQIFANQLEFDAIGNYQGFQRNNPLTQEVGKAEILHSLKTKLAAPMVMIGDSMADYSAGQVVDQFICFTGVTHREMVASKSDVVWKNFTDCLD